MAASPSNAASMGNDPSFAVAIDGLRSVAQLATETIVSSTEDGAKVTRAAFCAAADVEAACFAVLGQGEVKDESEVTLPSKKGIFSRLAIGRASEPSKAADGAPPAATGGSSAPSSSVPYDPITAQEVIEEYSRAWIAAQLAPITDIVVLHAGDAVPQGYQRLSHSVTGMYPADLNATSGPRQIWLAVARQTDQAPITGLCMVLLDQGEFVPPAFQPVRRFGRGPFNLRHGWAAPERGGGGPSDGGASVEAYLCVTRVPGAPIVDVGLIFPDGAQVQGIANMRKILTETGVISEGALAPGDAPPLVPPRAGFGGTAGNVEAMGRERHTLFNINLSSLPLLGGLKKEDVPPGYAVIASSLLDLRADLAGGTARGSAYVCYAKDLGLLDALGDPRSLAKHPRAALLASTGLPTELIFGPAHAGAPPQPSPYRCWALPDPAATAEALSHAAHAPPILPLWVARQRTARLRVAGGLGSEERTDGDETASLSSGPAAGAGTAAAGSSSSSSGAATAGTMRSIHDKMRVGFEKLFGGLSKSAPNSAAETGFPPAGGRAATSSAAPAGSDGEGSDADASHGKNADGIAGSSAAQQQRTGPARGRQGSGGGSGSGSAGAASRPRRGSHSADHLPSAAGARGRQGRGDRDGAASDGTRSRSASLQRGAGEAAEDADSLSVSGLRGALPGIGVSHVDSPGDDFSSPPNRRSSRRGSATKRRPSEEGRGKNGNDVTAQPPSEGEGEASDGEGGTKPGVSFRARFDSAGSDDSERDTIEADDEDDGDEGDEDDEGIITEEEDEDDDGDDDDDDGDIDDADDRLSDGEESRSPGAAAAAGSPAHASARRRQLQAVAASDGSNPSTPVQARRRAPVKPEGAASARTRRSQAGAGGAAGRSLKRGGASQLRRLDTRLAIGAQAEDIDMMMSDGSALNVTTVLPATSSSASPGGQPGGTRGSGGSPDSDEERMRNVLLYRLMSWVFSPSATRLNVGAAARHACPIDGSVSEANCLLSFLVPSPASVALAPLVRALYVRRADIARAALTGLTAVVDSGFFMTLTQQQLRSGSHPASASGTFPGSGPSSASDQAAHSPRPRLDSEVDGLVPPLTPEQEHAYVSSCGWALLDVIVAAACDACYAIVDQVHAPLTTFLLSVLRCAGATAAPRSSAQQPAPLPVGLHPSTLARVIATCLGVYAHTQQKRTYAARGVIKCRELGLPRDVADYARRLRIAEAECASNMAALKSVVGGVLAALEREAALPAEASLSALAVAGASGATSTSLAAFTGSHGRGAPPPPPLSGARSLFGDYGALSRTYDSYTSATGMFAADVHAAAQRFIPPRPAPALPAELASQFDSFSLLRRSPTADVLVTLGTLCKIAAEPIAASAEQTPAPAPGGKGASAGHPQPGGGSNASYKRMAALILRDSAMHLLAHAFDAAGPSLASSPLLVACASRFIPPVLFSHVISDRIFSPRTSICGRGKDAYGEEEPGALEDTGPSAIASSANSSSSSGSGGGGAIPPTSVLRAVLQVVSALWASRGCDADGSGRGGAAAADSGASPNGQGSSLVSLPTSVREACAREVGALLRGLVLHVLASRSAPARLRREALDELSGMISLPQALMELYLNHDLYPGPAVAYAHMRLTRSVVAALVTTVTSRHRHLITGGAAGGGPAGGKDAAGGDGTGDSDLDAVHPDDLPPTATDEDRRVAWEGWHREELRRSAAALLTSMVRALMDSAATVHLLPAGAGREDEFVALEGGAGAPGSGSGSANDDAGGSAPLSARSTGSASGSGGGGGGLRLVPPTPGVPGHSRKASSSASFRDVTASGAHRHGVSSSAVAGSGSSSTASGSASTRSHHPYPHYPGAAVVSVRALHERQRQLEAAFVAAAPIFADKGVKKGLAPLLAAGYVAGSPGGIAHFLRLCGSELSNDAEVGDYLGDEGRGPEEHAASRALRRDYLGAFSFAGMPFDVALRTMLTKGGFRLPGEAQKIDRITQAFAVAYYEDNRPTPQMLDQQRNAAAMAAASKAAHGAAGGPAAMGATMGHNADSSSSQHQAEHGPGPLFSPGAMPAVSSASAASSKPSSSGAGAAAASAPPPTPAPVQSIASKDGRLFPGTPDVVEILSFSAIMLNTDAHNASIKKERKMTRKQFVSNNRGIDKGADLPRHFLEYLYDSIVSNEIKTGIPHPGAPAAGSAGQGGAGGDAPGTPAAGGSGTKITAALFGSAAAVALSCGPDTTGEADVPPDARLFLKHASNAAFRWMNHVNACTGMDDARGAATTRASLYAVAASGLDAGADSPSGALNLDSPPTSGAQSTAAPVVPALPTEAVPTAFAPVPYRRSFSVTTVSCALTDLWPMLMRHATVMLRLQSPPRSADGGDAPSKLKALPPPACQASASAPAAGKAPGGAAAAGVAREGTKSAAVGGLAGMFTFGGGGTGGSPAVGGSAAGKQGTPASTDDGSAVAGDVLVARLGVATPGETELRLAALDTLKYAVSAALFLGLPSLIQEGANALLQVQAALEGVGEARRAKAGLDGWHNVVSRFAKACEPAASWGGPGSSGGARTAVDPSAAAEAISALHMAVAQLRERATSQAEAATVQNTAAQFKGEVGRLLAAGAGSRRLMYEGELVKVASSGHGKHTAYRFFLFTDMLVYAQRGPFGGKWQAHQRIPLRNLRFERDPPELRGLRHGFRLDTEVKPLFLIAANELELTEWRRHLREAVDELAATAERTASASTTSAAAAGKAAAAAPAPLMTLARDASVSGVSLSGMGRSASTPSSLASQGTASGSQAESQASRGGAPATPAAAAQPQAPAVRGPVRSVSSSAELGPLPASASSSSAVSGASASSSSVGATPQQSPAPAPVPLARSLSAGAAAAPSTPTTPAGPSAPLVIPIPVLSPDVPPAVARENRAVRPELYESIAVLKSAFLAAVPVCRPLLTGDSLPPPTGASGAGASPGGPGSSDGNSVSSLALSDADKLAFYAYFKQATSGDCPEPASDDDVSMLTAGTLSGATPRPEGQRTPTAAPSSPAHMSPTALAIAKAKREAWLRCRGMRRRDAMRSFVLLLDKTMPGWEAHAATVPTASGATAPASARSATGAALAGARVKH